MMLQDGILMYVRHCGGQVSPAAIFIAFQHEAGDDIKLSIIALLKKGLLGLNWESQLTIPSTDTPLTAIE